MQRQMIATGVVRSCTRISHSNADTDERKIVDAFKKIWSACDVEATTICEVRFKTRAIGHDRATLKVLLGQLRPVGRRLSIAVLVCSHRRLIHKRFQVVTEREIQGIEVRGM
ncbi:hypothetical protein TNCV_3641741 [Trichonephila clavipes]|nr:hypothetical protein TNCV_3641741 [Trichonephila clavipes]